MPFLFRPIGHTDEASSSLGDSRLWSPFSPNYAQRAGMRQLEQEESSSIVLQNPLPAAVRSRLLAYQRDSDNTTLVPVEAALAVGGLIVNREWKDAASFCRKLVSYYRAHGKKSGPEFVTWGTVYSAIAAYCDRLAAGREPLRRSVTKDERKHGALVSLWTDVRRSALADDGNVKLPFAAYSEMPVVTCPGAGGVAGRFANLADVALGAAVPEGVDVNGCASFCYSLKAFGKPSCLARLLVLTLGASVDITKHVGVVCEEMAKLATRTKRRPAKILRLFVDGDFRDPAAIEAWMEGIRWLGERFGVLVYGYSKSWHHFLSVNTRRGSAWWPTNYVLNLSSGSRFSGSALVNAMRQLPITRDEFIAVDPVQRLLWKALTKSRGERIYQAYARMMNRARGRAAVDSLRARLGRIVARGDPELAKAFNNYVLTIRDLEDNRTGVLGRVAKAIKAEGLKPGPVVQATTWAFLRKVSDGEVPCPISCGACPHTAIVGHQEVINAARLKDTAFLKTVPETMKRMVESVLASGKSRVHLCGNARLKRPIIIGLH